MKPILAALVLASSFWVSAQAEAAITLEYSLESDRSAAQPVDGAELNDIVYVFATSDQTLSSVEFFIDDVLIQREGKAPYDMGGTINGGLSGPYDISTAGEGLHSLTVVAKSTAGSSETLNANFTVGEPLPPYALLNSTSEDRVPASDLSGQQVSGDLYIFVEPSTDIAQISFYIDDPSTNGAPFSVDSEAPFDLGGTGAGSNALPVDSLLLTNDTHRLTAVIETTGARTKVLDADFTVNNPNANSSPTASFDLTCLDFECSFDASTSSDDGTIVAFDWDFGDGNSGTGVSSSHIYLTDGSFDVTLTVTDDVGSTNSVTQALTVPEVDYALLLGADPQRTAPVPLNGSVVGGGIFVFLSPEDSIRSVAFYIDNPAATGTPAQLERTAPFDLAGGASNNATPFDTTTLVDGPHQITVRLTLFDGSTSLRSADFDVDNANANPKPTASFNLACDEFECSFDASASSDNGTLVAYDWDYGDGNTGTGVSSSHVYTTDGSFDVTLTVTDDGGATDSVTQSLNVPEVNYALLLGADPQRTAPVPLNGAVVSGGIFVFLSPEDSIRSVAFYVDNPAATGTPAQLERTAPFDLAGGASNNATPFDSMSLVDGPHQITARITLSDGTTSLRNADFNVDNANANPSPTASFNLTCAEFECSFDASTSSDNGTIVTYAWDFGDGNTGTGVNSSHTYLADGNYDVTLAVTDDGGATSSATQSLTVPEIDYALLLGANPQRAAPVALAGAVVSGDIYVFLSPEDDISSVSFYIDNPAATGAADKIESTAPYDLAGGAPNSAEPFDTTTLTDGTHQITVKVSQSNGSVVLRNAEFTVDNANVNPNPATADFSVSCVELSCQFDAALGDPNNVLTEHDWTFGDGSSNTGAQVAHDFPGSGTYEVVHSAVDENQNPVIASQSVVVSDGTGCPAISTLGCDEIRVTSDLVLDFSSPAGGLFDGGGIATGFTMVDPPSFPSRPSPLASSPGFRPELVSVDQLGGVLAIDTTSGLQFGSSNNLDNALGIGLDLPSRSLVMETVLVDLPPATGGFAQGGLWFGSADEFGRGTTEDNYIKLVLVSNTAGGRSVQALMEQDGVTVTNKVINIGSGVSFVGFKMRLDPLERTVKTYYNDGVGEKPLQTFSSVPDAWFSFDQAGIDPSLSTRSFGGIFASHRNSANSTRFNFDMFSVVESNVGPVVNNDFEFDRWTLPVSNPTGTVWGPDGRLYVATIFGEIHAFTLDVPSRTILDEEIISTVRDINGGASRLTLGIAVDPASTASNMILWIGNSDGSINDGAANSGRITRLSGTSLELGQDVITGLPRAIANHAVNNIEFGPDGRLFIAIGGNTGSGAANNGTSEFGDRPEQPLSAAILVADVNAAGFQGECATPIGDFGVPATCDVTVYASGLRNSFDLTWHRNGQLYATDNGLGVLGTVPPSATPPCTALASPISDFNPGTQPDLLHRIEEGRYYGHPNPYRNECVFKDGSFQGVGPLTSFSNPMYSLGFNRSANGIIEYVADSFYGKLGGSLLIANFSVGDNITAVTLADNGMSVVGESELVGGFNNPLPLIEDTDGNIYVGEQGGGKVTVLIPKPLIPAPTGTWRTLAQAPDEVLDAGGAAVENEVFMVGGKNSSGHLTSVYSYDTTNDVWSSHPDLPGPGVENPSVASIGNLLYVMGGSTAPFSGAQNNARVYDTESATWSSLPSMIEPRGGAATAVLDGRIYVIGGMDSNGASLNSVEVFDVQSNSWNTIAPMSVRRDNPGAAVLDGRIYVFGGRIRNGDGTTIDGTLSSAEFYDPTSGTWSSAADMPTGRRTMAVGSIDGRALLIGGEDPVVTSNEEYDSITDSWRAIESIPLGRHGAAHATVNGRVYVIGGGPVSGSSFTNTLEQFSY